jgi:hypothetical protein
MLRVKVRAQKSSEIVLNIPSSGTGKAGVVGSVSDPSPLGSALNFPPGSGFYSGLRIQIQIQIQLLPISAEYQNLLQACE